MAWFRGHPRWGPVAAIASAALATSACELLAGIDDRSTAGTSAASSGASSSAASGAASGSGTTSASGGGGGTAGAGGGAACPEGYAQCDPQEPAACTSLNSMAHCGACDNECAGACLDGNCDTKVPTDFLVLWLRADAGVVTEGELVIGWQSEVGGGASSGTPSAQPKIGKLMSRPALVFDGVDDYMDLPPFEDCDGMTVFIAFSPEVGAPATLLRFGDGQPPAHVELYHQSGNDLVYEAFLDRAPVFLLGTEFYQPGSHLLTVVNDGAGTVMAMLDGWRTDAVVMTGAPPMVAATFSYNMLGSSAAQAPWFKGAVAEIMVYRAPLESTTAVEDYLRGKYVTF